MRLEQPLQRGTYIGGHEAAAIVGMHPHLSRADVWLKLTKRLPSIFDPSPAMTRGLVVEHGLLRYIDERLVPLTRMQPEPQPFASFWQDDDAPFFAGSPDGLCTHEDSIVEVTTATERTRIAWGADGTDAMAKHKYIQAQWYLGLTGRRAAHGWCLFVDTDELIHYYVPRRDKAIAELRDAAETFWFDHVIGGAPPAADDASTEDMLQAIYPQASIASITATEAMKNAAYHYATARNVAKAADIEKKRAGAFMRALLGPAAMTEWDGGSVYWTAPKGKATVDWNGVANELARAAKLPPAAYTDIVNSHVRTPEGTRALRVFIKKPKGGAS